MRTLLLLLLLAVPVWAEHTISHGGRDIVIFDAPEVQYRGQKEGKETRTFFSGPVGSGNLKITVRSKGWMSELKAEQRFQTDRDEKRNSQNTRLEGEVEIPGALKTLTFSMSSPYVGKGIIVYTKDFRCELLVTGTEEAGELIEPTYEQVLKTLKVVPRTKIGELKIGD
ncbi:MAG: hypothetical protein KC800_30045 [Candidatus Eremiobacteraeota bacterium]|nr:hypothetical protein [Candidatus Eremiobacteraeota bacterium]